MPYLIRELRESRSTLRRWAAAELGRLGCRAAAAVPVLQELQADSALGATASEALARIDGAVADGCS